MCLCSVNKTAESIIIVLMDNQGVRMARNYTWFVLMESSLFAPHNSKFSAEPGVLYVVATPIGNLADISSRAADVLASVDVIAAEDTRMTQRLLSHLGLKKKLRSLHAHNEAEQSSQFVDGLLQGQSVALVSDAGTPLISDPGFPLIREARSKGVQISPLPGPSAVIAALSVSGLACHRFAFEGFLPAKKQARLNALEALATETRTLVFYEATHRIVECLKDMRDAFGGDRMVCVARELTKTFEQVETATLKDLVFWIEEDGHRQKGEFVVMVEGKDDAGEGLSASDDALLLALLEELPVKPSSKLAAKITSKPAKLFYQRALELKR